MKGFSEVHIRILIDFLIKKKKKKNLKKMKMKIGSSITSKTFFHETSHNTIKNTNIQFKINFFCSKKSAATIYYIPYILAKYKKILGWKLEVMVDGTI